MEGKKDFIGNRIGIAIIKIVSNLIALFGLVMTCIFLFSIRPHRQGPSENTVIQLKQVDGVLEAFHRLCDIYPSTEQGLSALIEKPTSLYCPKYDSLLPRNAVLKDFWNEPLKYSSDGKKYRVEASHGLFVEGPKTSKDN
jgi:hypothetical protein